MEELKNRIETVTIIKNKEKRQEKKSQLPSILWLDNLRTTTKKSKSDYQPNILYSIYDTIGNKLKSSKEKLKKIRLNFFFTSPSGNGLKVGFRLDKPITDYDGFLCYIIIIMLKSLE